MDYSWAYSYNIPNNKICILNLQLKGITEPKSDNTLRLYTKVLLDEKIYTFSWKGTGCNPIDSKPMRIKRTWK
jgi:hypothetical protein